MAEDPARPTLEGARLATDPGAFLAAAGEQLQGRWVGMTGDEVEALIAAAVDDIAKLPEIIVWNVDWNHYGSGLSSLVPVVITRNSPELRTEPTPRWFHDGVVLALCRLAPLACLSAPGFEQPDSPGMLGPGSFLRLEHTGWQTAVSAIDRTLAEHGIHRLPPAVLERPIDIEIEIDTAFGGDQQTVFDAWFHWWD